MEDDTVSNPTKEQHEMYIVVAEAWSHFRTMKTRAEEFGLRVRLMQGAPPSEEFYLDVTTKPFRFGKRG